MIPPQILQISRYGNIEILAIMNNNNVTVLCQQVRETETWMPMKTTQTAAMSTHIESSGDSPNGSDFGFTDNEDDDDEGDQEYGVNDGEGDDYDDYYDDEDDVEENEDEYEFSGSGDGATTATPGGESKPSVKPDVNDNKIPEVERPTVNELDIVRDTNEIPLLGNKAETEEELPSNVLMAHASEDSIFNKTEVLADVDFSEGKSSGNNNKKIDIMETVTLSGQ
ncbi:Replicase polyprotein 1a, partial [Dissostichus eleginoides]